jgi:tRNA threonylcarbamoyladenosine biosynthesis protein TsaE
LSRDRVESAAETEALGARIASTLEPGEVVLVSGELGAGKTTLIRGACRELGVSDAVVSPTFTIGRRYRGRDRIWVSHLDLYRLADPSREEPWLLDDYLTADAISFIEWPEAAAELAPKGLRVAVRVRIEHAGGDAREIELTSPGPTDP